MASITTAADSSYRAFFERAPVALYRTAPDGTLLDVNPALLRLLGYPDRETFQRVNAADVYVDPSDRRRWAALIDSDDTVSFEMRDRRFDGSVIWVRDTARAVRNVEGTLLYYEGVLEDITAEKTLHTVLVEREERLRLLAEASEDVVWDWNFASGRVVWSAALKHAFGYDPVAIGPGIEQSYAWWIAHIHPDDRKRAAGDFHSAVEGGARVYRTEYRFRRLDGRYSRVLDRGHIGRDEEGLPVRLIGAMLDLDRAAAAPGGALPLQAYQRPPVPPTSDARLLEWMACGQEAALEELYERHGAMLLAVASQFSALDDEAEDVVAEVFVDAWTRAAEYSSARGSVSAWLVTMCRSRSLERTRKQGRRTRLMREALEQPDEHRPGLLRERLTTVDAGRLAARTRLKESFDRLPEPQRNVLELAYYEGMTHSEIAAHVDAPIGTVKTRIRDGLARVRRYLGNPPASIT